MARPFSRIYPCWMKQCMLRRMRKSQLIVPNLVALLPSVRNRFPSRRCRSRSHHRNPRPILLWNIFILSTRSVMSVCNSLAVIYRLNRIKINPHRHVGQVPNLVRRNTIILKVDTYVRWRILRSMICRPLRINHLPSISMRIRIFFTWQHQPISKWWKMPRRIVCPTWPRFPSTVSTNKRISISQMMKDSHWNNEENRNRDKMFVSIYRRRPLQRVYRGKNASTRSNQSQTAILIEWFPQEFSVVTIVSRRGACSTTFSRQSSHISGADGLWWSASFG